MNRVLTSVVATLGLFACLWVSRPLLATPIVEYNTPITSLGIIALVAIVAGALPALLMGVAYGAFEDPPVWKKALIVATAAAVMHLALNSLRISWWELLTWFVLPLECATLVLCFATVAWATSRLVARTEPATRRGGGLIVFVLVVLGAVGVALRGMAS